MDFKGKTVVITGASSGIGEALAVEFIAKGANVVAGSRSDMNVEAAVWVSTDVTKEADCKRLIDTAVERFGGIDVLVCNAGISMRALLDDVEVDVLKRLMEINFWGTVYCVKHALPWLQKSKGTIVGVSSVAGIHGLPGRTGYSASKYAMTGFLETVRVENLKKGVHVMIACPGFTASNVRFAALTADGSAQGETPRDEGKMMTSTEVAQRIIKGIAKYSFRLLP